MSTTWLESSDLVAKFQLLDKASTATTPFPEPSFPHADLTKRLSALSLTWADLATPAKRALLWDMGYVQYQAFNTSAYTRVYTKCSSTTGAPMSNIAMPLVDFKASQATATTTPCVASAGGFNMTYLRQQNAHGGKLKPATRCAVANVTGVPDSHSSMWAQDGQGLSIAPTPNLQRHAWNDGEFWLIMAIHTVSMELETKWDNCPAPDTPGGATIPCQVFDGVPPQGAWCIPAPTLAMDQWLTAIAKAKSSAGTTAAPSSTAPGGTSSTGGLSTGAIVGIAAAAIVALAVVLGCVWRRRRGKPQPDEAEYVEMRALSCREDGSSHHVQTRSTGTVTRGPRRGSQQRQSTGTGSYQPITTASQTLNEFQADPYLTSLRVPYASVLYTRVLSKGAFGEVWLGSLDGNVVALKRLLESRRAQEAEIESFADEIRLMASFSHPNIVTFIGFAWDSLQNLCAITEFMPQGDLSSFLQTQLQLQWVQTEKVKIALGVAHGLAYLHNLTPKIIHRDLKSKNVLMGADCVAKLSDFGISRERLEEATMTAGVGTINWTAPEVLVGGRYSEQADIYSFGCLLCEIDTTKSPYPDLKGLSQAAMIHRITQEGLRPAFNATCPPRVTALAARCFAKEPSDRPSARELAQILSD